ncbi:UDP-glucuronic acid decarboxylase 4-like, partial [Malus sylvestris]|uniref:UDP-glucuronic acid decarboxylase 4-like n=1 Tax=Malus sylvestris TaxID=3752 RepID=UPI0021AC5642
SLLPPFSLPSLLCTHPIQYLLREQRLVFILVGIAIATVGFTLLLSSTPRLSLRLQQRPNLELCPIQLGPYLPFARGRPNLPSGMPRFELIQHDIVEPLLLEVNHIYHLACPRSPVYPLEAKIFYFSAASTATRGNMWPAQ